MILAFFFAFLANLLDCDLIYSGYHAKSPPHIKQKSQKKKWGFMCDRRPRKKFAKSPQKNATFFFNLAKKRRKSGHKRRGELVPDRQPRTNSVYKSGWVEGGISVRSTVNVFSHAAGVWGGNFFPNFFMFWLHCTPDCSLKYINITEVQMLN